jgi:anti-anti-sigma factor
MHAPRADHPALQGLVIDALPQDGHVLVAVHGELDLGTTQALEAALRQAVDSSVQGVDLDLSGTAFCDCSALNVLIAARRRALDRHKTLIVRSASSAVHRLLTITGTLSLFAPEDQEPMSVRRPARPNTDGRPPGEHALNRRADAARHRPGPRRPDGLFRAQSGGRLERAGQRFPEHEHQASSGRR